MKQNRILVTTSQRLMRDVFFCAMLCLLASCVSTPVEKDFQLVYVTNSRTFSLLPPSAIECSLDSVQRITITYSGKVFSTDCLVIADRTQLFMSIFNNFGGSMGELLFTDNEISFSSAIFPSRMKPEYIVADFQFCFYDSSLIEASLKKTGLTFTVEIDGNTEKRTILDGKKCIVQIRKVGNLVTYINYLRGYSYVLEGIY